MPGSILPLALLICSLAAALFSEWLLAGVLLIATGLAVLAWMPPPGLAKFLGSERTRSKLLVLLQGTVLTRFPVETARAHDAKENLGETPPPPSEPPPSDTGDRGRDSAVPGDRRD